VLKMRVLQIGIHDSALASFPLTFMKFFSLSVAKCWVRFQEATGSAVLTARWSMEGIECRT